jgi:hypothetical protein
MHAAALPLRQGNPIWAQFLHWMVANVEAGAPLRSENAEAGKTAIEFAVPAPPYGNHRCASPAPQSPSCRPESAPNPQLAPRPFEFASQVALSY